MHIGLNVVQKGDGYKLIKFSWSSQMSEPQMINLPIKIDGRRLAHAVCHEARAQTRTHRRTGLMAHIRHLSRWRHR